MQGEDIKNVYDAARAICLETGDMLRALEGEFAKQNFEQKVKNKKMTTYDLGNPAEWMPYFLELVFAERGSESKRGIGTAVLFDTLDRRQLKFPVVFCGALTFSRSITKNFSYNLYYFCSFRTKNPIKEDGLLYKTTFAGADDFNEGVGYFLRLESLQDRQSLVSLVVEPCRLLVNEKFDDARSAIAKVAVKAEDFFANGG
jgi:hypothetical protein